MYCKKSYAQPASAPARAFLGIRCTHLEHRDGAVRERLVVLARPRERLDAPQRAEAERALLAADAVVRLRDIVPVDQPLRT